MGDSDVEELKKRLESNQKRLDELDARFSLSICLCMLCFAPGRGPLKRNFFFLCGCRVE
jgi:hypothetical protein